MLDWFCYLIGAVAVIWALALIAFPELLYLENPKKKKSLKIKHWGMYEDCPGKDDAEEDGVEIQVPARKRREVVGSQTYEAGRGISFRS